MLIKSKYTSGKTRYMFLHAISSFKPGFQKFSKYGGRNTITAITGDGVGPELLQCVQKVFRYDYNYLI